MTVTLIAAVGANRAIGRDNDLPWHLPEDLAHFKRTTLGHTLVMGRRTYDSIGRTLPGRTTVVVTRQAGWSAPGVQVAHSLEEALGLADGGEVFVAGGGQVYAQALPLADALVLTEVERSPQAEVFFPEVDPADWHEVSREPRDGFSFVTYERVGRPAGGS
jgi:dihydrofolate reductase